MLKLFINRFNVNNLKLPVGEKHKKLGDVRVKQNFENGEISNSIFLFPDIFLYEVSYYSLKLLNEIKRILRYHF